MNTDRFSMAKNTIHPREKTETHGSEPHYKLSDNSNTDP